MGTDISQAPSRLDPVARKTAIAGLRMNRNLLFWNLMVFDVVGLLMSAYLTYLSFVPPTSCIVGTYSIFSCNEVLWSKYSHIYGVSVALLGLGWFVVVSLLLLLARHNERYTRAIVAWSILGAAGVSAFVYTEVFLLRTICQLCTVAHISGLAILVLSILTLRTRRETNP